MAEATLNIKTIRGESVPLKVTTDINILQLKERIAAAMDIPAAEQKLIFNGRIMTDSQTLAECDIEDGCSIHLVRNTQRARPTPAASPKPAYVPPQQAPSTSTAPSSGASTTSSPFSGASGNPFASTLGGMGGMPGMGGLGQMMQTPMMRQMMNSVLSNPEMMRAMMQSNPMMQQMMNSNPQMKATMDMMLSNPELMRMSMQMMDQMFGGEGRGDTAGDSGDSVPEGLGGVGGSSVWGSSGQSAHTQQPDSTTGAHESADISADEKSEDKPTQVPPSSAPTSSTSTGPAPNPAASMFGASTFGDEPPMFPGMGGMGGMDGMRAMMQNPMLRSMIESVAENPEMLRGMMQSPIMQQMTAGNPQLKATMEMMINNPQMMKLSLQMMNTMAGAPSSTPSSTTTPPSAPSASEQAPPPPYSATAGSSPGRPPLDFSSLFSQLGAMTGSPAAQSTLPPSATPHSAPATSAPASSAPLQQTHEELMARYSTQIQELHDMGFLDDRLNIEVLKACNGSVQLAVERLVQRLGLE